MKRSKLNKSSVNALKNFLCKSYVGLPSRTETWEELIVQGYVVQVLPESGTSLGNEYSITPKGLRLLADMLEKN